jgi:uncharacterized protein
MKRCPRCRHQLNQVQLGSVHVDGCGGCGGVWFDNTELHTVAQTQAADMLALEDQFLPGDSSRIPVGDMTCPNCNIPLYGFSFPQLPGIQLDACSQCKGIWADDGELQALYARMLGTQTAAAPAAVDTHRAGRQAMGILASRPCPQCKKSNPTAGHACWACGCILPQAGRPLCPNCDVPLRARTFQGIALETCPDCTGVWLDPGELTALSEYTPEELERVQNDAAVKRQGVSVLWNANPTLMCPRCTIGLIESEHSVTSGVRLQSCAQCYGVWIGASTLQMLSRYYTQTLARRRPLA